MKHIEAGPNEKVIEPNEVFKYTGSDGQQYTLIAICASYDACDKGCVFNECSGHPLSTEFCEDIGLDCTKRLFKPIDDILENL